MAEMDCEREGNRLYYEKQHQDEGGKDDFQKRKFKSANDKADVKREGMWQYGKNVGHREAGL